MKKHLLIAFASFTLLAPLLSGCGGDSSSLSISLSQEEGGVTSISLSAETTTLKERQTTQLSVAFTPDSVSDKSVSFVSSNEAVLTVSDTGLVSALSVGNAEVIATSKVSSKTSRLAFSVIANDPYADLPIVDYSNALRNTPYTLPTLSGQGNYGLSESSQVGVNQSAIAERFPIASDDTFEAGRILRYQDLTLAQVQTYFPSASEMNPYYRFQTLLNQASSLSLADKPLKIALPGGSLEVDTSLSTSSKTFVASSLKNVMIEGNDTAFVLNDKELAWKGFIDLSDSQQVIFNDVAVDQAIPASLTASILSMDVSAKTAKLAIDPSFDPLVEALLAKKKALRSYVEFDLNSKAPLKGGNFLVDAFSDYLLEGTSGNYTITVTFSKAISRSRNGSLVSLQFAQYDAPMVGVTSSSDIFFDNLTIHHAAGMAFTASDTRNLYLNRYQLAVKEGSKSLMTACADGIHLNQMHGDCQITNSLIEYSHDDALNIKHGYWYKVADAEGGTTKRMSLARITSGVKAPRVGDKMVVYEEESLLSHNPTQGYYTLASVSETTTGYDVTVNERMSNVTDWKVSRASFLSDLPTFRFTNNIVRNKRNRGILVQVPDAVVENNAFMNVGHGSIQAATALDVFNEATMPQRFSLKNNKFVDNCYLTPDPLLGDVSYFAIGNNGTVGPATTLSGASFENNFFSGNGNAAFSLRGVSASSISHTLFYECNKSQPTGESYNCLVNAYNVSGLSLASSYNYYTLDQGQSGLILQGLTSESDVSLTDNVNIAFQQSEEEGPKVDIAKATNAITVDGDLSEWSSEGTAVDLLGYSIADGTETTKDAIASHFAVKKLALSWGDLGIYLAFDIFDNQLNVKTVNDFWLGDCVELFMSTITNLPNADMQVYKDQGGVIQAAFAPTWTSSGYYTMASVRTNSAYLSSTSKISASLKLTSDGYQGEILVPFAMAPEFKSSIDSGNRIAMAIVAADGERSDIGLQRVQVGNVPHFVETYKTKTARMPQYLFK